MQLTQNRLLMVFALVAISLLVILYIQYDVFSQDVYENERQMELVIPGILVEVHDRLNWNKDFRNRLRRFQGVEEFTITTKTNSDNPLQRQIKQEMDRTLSLNYPRMEYILNAFISSEHACLIHSDHHDQLPKANKVLNAENHMCLCSLSPTTFDMSITYPNKESVVLARSWQSLVISLILMMFVLLAFALTIFIINRQKKLSVMKRDFVNNLTHEFKTPLFSISLASKALKKSEAISASSSLSKYIDVIESESARLKNQVDKILQMALIDSGNLTLEKKQVDLHQIIEKVAESFRVIIQEREGSLMMDLRSKSHIVLADETHLKNIIYNLLDNAQKYSEDQPLIELKTEDHQEGILLSVRDNGIGMDQEAQKFIFDQFYRATPTERKNATGFGLGLSYVKSIVEAHKGWINLQSQLKKGSEFTIYLPLA